MLYGRFSVYVLVYLILTTRARMLNKPIFRHTIPFFYSPCNRFLIPLPVLDIKGSFPDA